MTSGDLPPWVLICGGFHHLGGMDRANFELALALAEQGREVFLVGHNFDAELLQHPRIHTRSVRAPMRAILLGESVLSRTGLRVADEVLTRWPRARVVVNGGNCPWADINWVHLVHAAASPCDAKAPLWFRTKNRLNHRKALRDESLALRKARVVIANSERTKRDLIDRGVPEEKIRMVRLGCGVELSPVTPEERLSARRLFHLPPDAPVVCFVGALGYDRRKGFDILLAAWHEARLKDAYLLAAGGGRGLSYWRQQVRESGYSNRIRLLGFTDRIREVLGASDLLVSPARYEPFGLNVQEAIASGVPAIVSRSAGASELYPTELHRFLITDPEDPKQLAEMLRSWYCQRDQAKSAFACLGEKVRSYTWRDMANCFIAAVEEA